MSMATTTEISTQSLLANLTLANRFEVLLPFAEPIIPIQTLKVAFRLLIVESMRCG